MTIFLASYRVCYLFENKVVALMYTYKYLGFLLLVRCILGQGNSQVGFPRPWDETEMGDILGQEAFIPMPNTQVFSYGHAFKR